ncbi:VOC family protein [Flexibacterium corallicola]|uniref:hypothetical protein n=1 Tax=Flexibacterium corallicola TaxID=3037259 RepID=UPI00286F6AD4|nr:hypothetical protein [Pseudovibrio sp. M1P-2-3]
MEMPEHGKDRPDPKAYGNSHPDGMGVNLLVEDVQTSAKFHKFVFGSTIRYWEEHFAIMESQGHTWLLHSDWSYRNHEMMSAVQGLTARGGGLELRLYGINPDEAEEKARQLDATVLSGSINQAHGMREAHILDPDGYVWVPSQSLSE